MRSNTWRALFLLSLTLILVSAAMDAQAARRSSLAGNQFINDPDDMFAFPQLTHQYKNRVIFDLGQGGEEGSGSVVFGDNSVWNFNTGRGMYANTTSWAWGGTDRMPMGFENPDYEWWDLGWATHFGDTPFGVRINWQADSNEQIPQGQDDPNFKDSTSMFGIQLGTTLGSVQLAAEFGFGSYKDETPGLDPSDQNDMSMSLITLLGRGDLEDVGGLDWRWIAAFTTGKGDPKADQVPSYSLTAFRASFGPVWGTPGEWEVAAYMSFDYQKDEEPNFEDADLKETNTMTVFPAYNMAMEYYLNSWFVLRGGVMSMAGSDKYEYQYAADDTEEDSDRFYDMHWTLGLGVDKGNWGLDMALNEDNVHSGYIVFNGDQQYEDHPLALISAWLAW
jgi:hypothetical protein